MEFIEFTKDEFKNKIVPNFLYSKGQQEFYVNQKDKIMFKLYKNKKQGLTINKIKKLELSQKIDDKIMIRRPKYLVSIDGTLVGYSFEINDEYRSIDKFYLPLEEKINLLFILKNKISELSNQGIYFDKANYDNILYNGYDVLLSDFPDAYYFKELNEENLFTYENFNRFSVAFLNNLPLKNIDKKIEKTIVNWYNLRKYNDLVGVTDNQFCLGIWYDIIYGEENNNKTNDLIIDNLNKVKLKNRS